VAQGIGPEFKPSTKKKNQKNPKKAIEARWVLYTYDLYTREVEGRELWVLGQPGVHGETLSQKKEKKQGKNKGILDNPWSSVFL
jgi:hypothetical protein